MKNIKKLAAAAVAVVMAGSLMLPLAACGGNNSNSLNVKLDSNGKLTYAEGTTLKLNVGNSATQTTAFTSTELSASFKFPDGKNYTSTDLKPAWQAMADQLNLNFVDSYVKDSNSQIDGPVSTNTVNNYDIITGSLTDAVNDADYLLNLTDYLDYMPNYKAFLEANEVTRYSLIANAQTGAMYAAPYFDGNDDIEKYDMVRRDWVVKILDGDTSAATTTFKAQADAKGLTGTAASAEAYMGTTGSWTVETTNLTDDTKTTTLKVNYDAALTAAKDSSSALGSALSECNVTLSGLTSGNIVDLQNAAIKAKSGAVTGDQLAKILRAYIDVAYTTNTGAKFYDTRSDVFNSASGAWDVDLLVAMLRCVVTSQNLFETAVKNLDTNKLYGIMARQSTTQRRVDLLALAGELYGIRGMESRLSGEFAYIDNDGKLQDARLDEKSYELLSNMSGLAKEGLLYTGTDGTDGKNSYVADDSKAMAFMTHDYVQTQTRYAIEGSTASADMPEGYDFAPIVTPVSKWDVDGDGNRTDIMRFTESWRSVKNTGFVVPKGAVQGNPDKLSAVLAFIDYMFSSDGQYLLTYGPRSTSNTDPDGWWYCEESDLALSTVADLSIPATNYCPAQYTVKDAYKQQVFVYEGKVYEGLKYADRNVPIMTDASKNWFLGLDVNGVHPGQSGLFSGVSSVVGNYTNYARQILGTTLPIANKDQGFEYQCTAAAGLAGAAIVATAINNGTIKHVKLSTGALASDEGLWYLAVPTMIPMSGNDRTTMKSAAQTLISGTYFYNNSKTNQLTNVYIDILFYGLGDTAHYICGDSALGTLKLTGASYISSLVDKDGALTTRVGIYKNGWLDLDELFNITSK